MSPGKDETRVCVYNIYKYIYIYIYIFILLINIVSERNEKFFKKYFSNFISGNYLFFS